MIGPPPPRVADFRVDDPVWLWDGNCVDTGGDTREGWDFFVSYTHTDQAWAVWVAWVLEDADYRVLIQAWDFVPGSNWVKGMQDGAEHATRTIAIVSDEYLESVYGSAEWQAAWAEDPSGLERKLLPVRVRECKRPGLLKGVTGFDLFGLDEAAARTLLLAKVKAAVEGRAKPPVKPAFPVPAAGRTVDSEPRFPGAPPRVWNVPPHNPNFTGRSTELADLARGLTSGTAVTVHSLHGLGGVGKTQLAAEYAHAHAGDYELVWWVAAEEASLIPDQFSGLVRRLGLEPVTDPDGLRAQVYDQLSAAAGWLLVFDNADAADDVRVWLPAAPQPTGIPGHVLVTTRRRGFGSLGPVMDLDVISMPDAVRLLRTRVPDLDQATGEAIADELGRLPLALEQAAAYMDRAELPGTEYLELLHTQATELYARGRVSSRSDTIATLWNVSLDRAEAENPAAVQLLEICSYLAPEPVPLDLLTAHTDLLPAPLSTAAASKLDFTDTIAVLTDYSLAKRSPAGLQVHRLVQAAVRARRDGTKLPAQLPQSRP
jgi:TIR domain